jgi:kinetochor protein Mis14/NSL1
VKQYIRETFSTAKDSLSINGMDSQELDAELAKIQEGEGKWKETPTIPCLTRDGRDSSPPNKLTDDRPTELAPFDTSLATKIQSLSTQIEAQTLHLASVRRKAPAQSAQRFLSNFEAQLASSAARLRSDEEARLAEARGASVSTGILPQRPEEVGETFLRGVRDLQGVKGGIAATLDRLERAQRAVEVVGEK